MLTKRASPRLAAKPRDEICASLGAVSESELRSAVERLAVPRHYPHTLNYPFLRAVSQLLVACVLDQASEQ